MLPCGGQFEEQKMLRLQRQQLAQKRATCQHRFWPGGMSIEKSNGHAESLLVEHGA